MIWIITYHDIQDLPSRLPPHLPTPHHNTCIHTHRHTYTIHAYTTQHHSNEATPSRVAGLYTPTEPGRAGRKLQQKHRRRTKELRYHFSYRACGDDETLAETIYRTGVRFPRWFRIHMSRRQRQRGRTRHYNYLLWSHGLLCKSPRKRRGKALSSFPSIRVTRQLSSRCDSNSQKTRALFILSIGKNIDQVKVSDAFWFPGALVHLEGLEVRRRRLGLIIDIE